MINGIDITNSVSLTLGIMSAVLGIVAIAQATFYKREQERQALIQEAFLKEQRINMTYACIRNRIIYRQVCLNQKNGYRKDRALIYATASFYSQNIQSNLEDIETLLRKVIKRCYSDSVIEKLKKLDIHEGDLIYEVWLRSESDLNYLESIIAVNEELDRYGLYLSLMVE